MIMIHSLAFRSSITMNCGERSGRMFHIHLVTLLNQKKLFPNLFPSLFLNLFILKICGQQKMVLPFQLRSQ